MVNDADVALRTGFHDVEFLLFRQELDVGCLVGFYVAGQTDDFLLGVGQAGNLLVDFALGAFEYRQFIQNGFIGRVFRSVQFCQTRFFGFEQGDLGFDAGQAFKRAFGLKRNIERTGAFAIGVEFVFCVLQGFFQTR